MKKLEKYEEIWMVLTDIILMKHQNVLVCLNIVDGCHIRTHPTHSSSGFVSNLRYILFSMECFFQKNLKVNFYNEPITEVVIILYRLFNDIYIRE